MQVQTTTWAEIERLADDAIMSREARPDEIAAMAAGCPKHGDRAMSFNDDRVFCIGCLTERVATYPLATPRQALAGAR